MSAIVIDEQKLGLELEAGKADTVMVAMTRFEAVNVCNALLLLEARAVQAGETSVMKIAQEVGRGIQTMVGFPEQTRRMLERNRRVLGLEGD